MKIEKFEPQNLKALRASLIDALQAVAAQHGIRIDVGSMSYGEAKVSVKLIATTDLIAEVKKRDVEKYLGMYDLANSEAIHNGKPYKIVEFKHNRTKMPVIVSMGDGKLYQMTTQQAQKIFGASRESVNLVETPPPVSSAASN